MLLRPRVAFHAPGVVKPVAECNGAISKEQIMMYPPGIPLIVPGEVWTQEIIDRIEHYESLGIKLLSAYNNGFEVVDLAKWPRFATYERKLKAYLENRRTTPTADGFHLPFEGLSHEKTLVLVPFRGDTWRNKAIPAQEAFKNVIKAIALHEKVVVGVHPAIFQNVASKYRGIKNVELLAIRYDDAWARDNTPLFVTNGKALRTVDFRFNAWGGNYNGLYRNYKDDDHLAARLSKKWDLPNYYLSNFVLEGGSIAVDGEGTLITTEACLLSQGRNPAFNKVQIEEILETYLGVQKVIWVPHGIYLDETDEHIDNMVSFIKPGEVVMAWTNNKNDPQFEYCLGTFEALKKATDAKGRKLVIHKMLLPDPPLFLTVEESKGLSNTSATLAKREAGRRLAASYINYYQGKDFVVMPAFGVKEDHKAFEMMKKLYPNKVIHQINTKEILLGGGNIHCITMQVPEKEE